MSLEGFNPEQLAHDITTSLFHRMQEQNLAEPVIQQAANMLFEFMKISGMLILQEQGIQLPGSLEPIPYTLESANQAMTLFGEGIYSAMLKSLEMNVPEGLQQALLQNVAQHVFEQSKQVVLSTMGQEHTPELQFSLQEQIKILAQTSESALLHYINEYERQNGPIHGNTPAETPASFPATPVQLEQSMVPDVFTDEDEEDIDDDFYEDEEQEESLSWDEDDAPADLSPVMEPLPVMPSAPVMHSSATGGSLPGRDEKYAAIAMLLLLLPKNRKVQVMGKLSPAEQERVRYFDNPERITQDLDMKRVNQYLDSLKAVFHQVSNKSVMALAFDHLLQSYSPDGLRRLVANERSKVRQTLEHLLGESPSAGGPPLEEWEVEGEPSQDILSGVMEEHLFQYLKQKLESGV